MGLRPALIRMVLAAGLAGALSGCQRPPRVPPPTRTAFAPRPAATPDRAASAAEPSAPPSQVFLPTGDQTPAPLSAAPPLATARLPEEVEPTSPPPARLSIPELGLDQTVVKVSIKEGDWDLSGLGAEVGWLMTTGERPGVKLAPVLVAHVALSDWGVGPFNDLWRLPAGADIFYDWQGQRYHYQVAGKRRVAPEAAGDIYIPDGQQLLLMTCDGWDYAVWRYTERLLVSATLVEVVAAP